MNAPNNSLDIEKMRHAASDACVVLRVLANEDRLLLLCQLTEGERCVSELEELVGIHQPTLSQQLGVLRNEGLVTTRREGKNIYYQIASPEVLALLQVLHDLYCPPMTNSAKRVKSKS